MNEKIDFVVLDLYDLSATIPPFFLEAAFSYITFYEERKWMNLSSVDFSIKK